MTNHKWTNMADELPPFDKEYVAYIPELRQKYHIGKDTLTGNNARMRVVGGLFGWDQPPIEKWILCEEILPPLD